MKKYFVVISILIAFVSVLIIAQNQSISIAERWLKVDTYSKKQLPESALKELEIIINEAQKNNNSPQLIKALIYKMRFSLDKNPAEMVTLLKEFENFTEKSTNPTERALLHSMTAELYTKYYQQNQWNINKRTIVIGSVLEDINEWTKNIFFDKITNHLAASLQPADILQKTDVLKYEALIEKGDDSKTLEPSLFDFLAKRKIDILLEVAVAANIKNPLFENKLFADAAMFALLPLDTVYKNSAENQVLETYQQLLSFRTKDANESALLLVDLQRLKYIKNNSENPNTDSLYLSALSNLENQFANNEAVVEVLFEKANYYLMATENEDIKWNKKIAYDICSEGIKQFPNYTRIGLLKNIQNNIFHKGLSVRLNQYAKPNTNLKIAISSSNLPTLQMSIYKINASAKEFFNYQQNNRNERSVFEKHKLIDTKIVNVKNDPNFRYVNTNLEIKTGDYGIYQVCVEAVGNKSKYERAIESFIVTDLGVMFRTNSPKTSSFYVLDRKTGNTQPTVKVSLYKNKWIGSAYDSKLKTTAVSDKKGYCEISTDEDYNNVIFLEKGKDIYFSESSNSYFSRNNREDNKIARIDIFTDRSLYRPGQSTYFKAIVYFSNKTKQAVVAGVEYDVTLFDANSQKVSSKKYKTNEFGSLAGEFILPNGGLNGAYRLQVGNVSHTIYVEEYKRPTFEVTIAKPKTEVSFGQKVTVTGTVKAYAGYAIAGAKVKYRVVRSTHRNWRWWHSGPEKEITNGSSTSKSDGTFEVTFTPEKSKTEVSPYLNEQFFTYTISAEVTDPKGETQKGEQYLSVGDKSLFIIAEVAKKANKKEAVNIAISTETLNGEKTTATVNYSLYRLENSDAYAEDIDEETEFKVLEKVLSGTYNTKDKTLNLNINKLNSGRYKILFTTSDIFGREVKLEKTLVIYSTNDKQPAVKSYVWLLEQKTDCKVGDKALIQFGTSTTNSMVLYELMQGNTILERKWVNFSNEIKTFEISFKETYGAGVTVMFSFIKDEQFFTKSVQLTRKVEEKKLTPTLSVFRNKLLPGEKAEWTITVPESANANKQAELMVGMYDASLDAIRAHRWNFNPAYREAVLYSPQWNGLGFRTNSGYAQISNQFDEIKEFQFNRFNWFGLDFGGRISTVLSGRIPGVQVINNEEVDEVVVVGYGTRKMSATVGAIAASDKNNEDVVFSMVETKTQSNVSKPKEPIKARTNFNETAFFYPQLRTDAQGNVKFTFTAPESLTRWNVKMLAHSQDLYFGQAAEQIVTQKDLMVQMNLPRFVRRSDKLVLSANVINLTEKDLNANITFELIDPATEKTIFKETKKAPLFLGRGVGGEVVEFELSDFSSSELLICKVVAQAGNFSDGEQKYLPVLPDKILLTESLPLTIRGNQTRTFNFESLLKNGSKVDTKSLTIEFSSNPTWYAIQALPTLSTPESDNAIDYFTAYYVNSLAAFIANSNPKIAKIFDQWKNTTGSRDALISNLQKNTELKNMLLEETPWVMAAKDESEQKRQIALLFDLNMQKNQANQYMEKLVSLQLPSGGFSWFKGMIESRYVTQEIMLNLARLSKMTKQSVDRSQQSLVNSALSYLDLEIARDFATLKKYNKNYAKEMCVGNLQLFYLHMRSEYPTIPIHVSAQEAVKFYTAQSEKYWTNFTLYGKAMMAVLANRNGKIKTANDILKSLKENALKTDEFGMYWAKNTAGYFWNERPIAVQAAIIEAFAEVSNDPAELDEMKIWLLKQKQTQRWDSPTATVNAIYALVHYGGDWLTNDTQTTIKLGNTILKHQQVEAGTGYFKEVIPATNVKPEMGKITVSTSDSFTPSEVITKKRGIGWGAMYLQYYQDLEKVESQGAALKISKKLFVLKRNNEGFTQSETLNNSSTTMQPLEQNKVKKGDKIITRLVITSDRNLEFVALKDLRASCFEPVIQQSGCEWKEGLCYYRTTKDASTQFFFSYLPKGTYVFEYELWANNSGEFTSGIATIQCHYAPEFSSHTGGERIFIK